MVMPSLSLVRHPGWCGPGLNTGFRPAAGDSDSRTGPSYQLTGASAGQVRGSDVSRRRAGARMECLRRASGPRRDDPGRARGLTAWGCRAAALLQAAKTRVSPRPGPHEPAGLPRGRHFDGSDFSIKFLSFITQGAAAAARRMGRPLD